MKTLKRIMLFIGFKVLELLALAVGVFAFWWVLWGVSILTDGTFGRNTSIGVLIFIGSVIVGYILWGCCVENWKAVKRRIP